MILRRISEQTLGRARSPQGARPRLAHRWKLPWGGEAQSGRAPQDAGLPWGGSESEAGVLIRPFMPEEDGRRDEFVLAHADSTLFHLSAWGRAAELAFGSERRDLVAIEGESIVGILPLASCRRALGGTKWISSPWGVYGGPLASRPQVAERLVEAAVELAREAGARRLELRCREDPGLTDHAASDLYVTFRKTLPEREEEVEDTFPRTARKNLRRALGRDGLRVEEGHHLRRELSRLFLSSKRSLGSPGLPECWWEALEAELGDRYVLHGAFRGDACLAVTLTFLHREEASMYYIGTAPRANQRFHVTTFLIARCMEWSVRNGYRRFDLGRSRKDTGACAFKVLQGFEPTPLHYRYGLLDGDGILPSFHPSNPRTTLLRSTWTRLPLWVCGGLSRVLAPYLP